MILSNEVVIIINKVKIRSLENNILTGKAYYYLIKKLSSKI